MSKLCFVFSWKNASSGSWSGTPKGLYDAFIKKIKVRKLNVSIKQNNFILKLITKIILPTLEYSHAKKIINNDANANDKEPYFVFGEYNSKFVNRTFCYQDFSIDYLIRDLKKQAENYPFLYKLKVAIFCYTLKFKQKEAAKFYENCAGVFTMSQWLKRDMIENTGISENKIFSVGGGCSVDTSLIDTSNKKGNKFLFVGKNWVRKNGDLVVAAFEKLLQLHPESDLELYVAGPSTPPPSVIGKKNINFIGLLSREELAHYYNMCDYFVMPSNFEGYGLVFAEALIFGLPCIGKDCYAMPEFIHDDENGYLIRDNDVDQLVEAMDKLFINGKRITDYVQKHHDFYVKEYSWDSVVERILTVIKEQGFDLSENDE
ncbi:MAG: glycosyltransferase family 4 protein [Clostridia bacterium]|nr:glycosyltransferase family 4 protein [Clostridia bacterium]